MQFGICGVGDISTDPTTGQTQNEAERMSGAPPYQDSDPEVTASFPVPFR